MAEQVLPPEPPKFDTVYTPEHAEKPYDDFQHTAQFRYASGRVQMAVAAKPGSRAKSKVIQLHAPMSQMVLTWRALRRGVKPLVPAPKDLNGAPLLEATWTRPLEVPLPDGQGFAWQIEGTYIYALEEPLDPDNLTLPGPGSPACNFDPADHDFIPADFDGSLLPQL